MSRVKQDWRLVKEVPGLLARVEWHGGVSFGTVCPQCYRMHEGPSLEELGEVVCKCGWEARQVVIAFVVEMEEKEVKGE